MDGQYLGPTLAIAAASPYIGESGRAARLIAFAAGLVAVMWPDT